MAVLFEFIFFFWTHTNKSREQCYLLLWIAVVLFELIFLPDKYKDIKKVLLPETSIDVVWFVYEVHSH